MSSDVIIGHDGKPRCAWVGAGDTAFGRYHDEVWGTRTYDESAMFEALTLGVFEVGLSWSIVFGKRDAFRKAFRGFDVAKVAAMTELAKSYAITRKGAPRSLASLPTSTPQTEAFAKQLKSQGYRFVGPTSVYVFMQKVGVINDHIHGCFRAIFKADADSLFRRPRSVHQRPRSAEGVEELDCVLASVAGEVAVVAVDHGQAGADVAGEVEC